MEVFRKFLKFLGLYKEQTKVDFIRELPPEISEMILRMLDAKSLESSLLVSRKWMYLCDREKDRRQRQINRNLLRHSGFEFFRNCQCKSKFFAKIYIL